MKQIQFEPLLGIQIPVDGFTREEKLVVRSLGENAIEQIYAKLPTSRMKAVAAMHYELGYNQELIARIFAVTQERVSQELDLIRKLLLGRSDRSKTGRAYQPRREKVALQIPDIIRVLWVLHRQ